MKMATFCYKRRLFIRNYPILQQKNFASDHKKKLQPQISVFIKKNSIFGSNRDPSHVPQLPEWVGEPDYRDPCFTISTEFTIWTELMNEFAVKVLAPLSIN